MIICGIDPGGTTGVVLLEWEGEILPDPDSLIRAERVSFEAMPIFTARLFTSRDPALGPIPDIIAIERFHISARTIRASSQPEALYVLGGVMFYAKNSGIPVRIQNASDAKAAVGDSIVDVWDVRGPHEKDALRHALLACRVKGLYDRVRSGTWTSDDGD